MGSTAYESVTNFLLDKMSAEEVPNERKPEQTTVTPKISVKPPDPPPPVHIPAPKKNSLEKQELITTKSAVTELRYVITEQQVELEELRCGLCFRLPNEAVQTEGCGHLFCETCIVESFSKKPMCPSCGVLTQCYFVDKRARRRIEKL